MGFLHMYGWVSLWFAAGMLSVEDQRQFWLWFGSWQNVILNTRAHIIQFPLRYRMYAAAESITFSRRRSQLTSSSIRDKRLACCMPSQFIGKMYSQTFNHKHTGWAICAQRLFQQHPKKTAHLTWPNSVLSMNWNCWFTSASFSGPLLSHSVEFCGFVCVCVRNFEVKYLGNQRS